MTKQSKIKRGDDQTGCGRGKKGFTIIEVVLVLAIAGLIFLMVFIALPALQRAQRNTQRENDLSRFLTAITDFQTNNNGQMPFCQGACPSVNGQWGANDVTLNTAAGTFAQRYIDSGCAAGMNLGTAPLGCGDQFTDPDGTIYQFLAAPASGAGDGVMAFPTFAAAIAM
jgi:prepilin-type N-terminal cleavage/methylation domain-containing protein